jgi:hypothetical protein
MQDKEKLRKVARYAIGRLTRGVIYGKSETTCALIDSDNYADFLIRNKILRCSSQSIKDKYFSSHNISKITSAKTANLFRMMVVVEYCIQNGVEL